MTYPQPAPALAKSQLVINWLAAIGWNPAQNPELGYLVVAGPEILTAPDRLVTVTPTPGPGWVTEEAALDTWGFQARVRGPADDPFGPELAAQQLDVMILNGPYPVTVSGVSVRMATRAGGHPVPLPLSPEDRRFEFTCTYLITTALE